LHAGPVAAAPPRPHIRLATISYWFDLRQQ
jgi:hypothetical protein